MRSVVLWVVLAGCAAEGRTLDGWTLDVEGGPRGVAVTLPGNFATAMPFREANYTLTTEVAIVPALRGTAIALVVDCFHGPLVLTANGVVVEDRGDGGGAYRFRIDPALTNAPTVSLRLAVHRDVITAIGFGVAPRLTSDPDGDPRSRGLALFNRYSSLTALAFALLMSVIYMTLYLLDRKRPEYGAILLNSISVTAIPLFHLGAIHALGEGIGQRVFYVLVLGQFISLIYFIHTTFALGPVSRRWWIVWALAWVADLVSSTSFQAGIVLGFAKQPLTVVVNAYVIVRLIQLARRGTRRVDAALMLAGWGTNAIWIALALVWIARGQEPLAGVHPLSAGIAMTSVLQALIISRQHVARQREIESASSELKRQVAERSRELGDALAKLSQRSAQPFASDRTIDDRYRVIDKLGAGGMGTVFEVERISDQRRFALKTLRGRGETDLMARFAREAQIAAETEHPNLVPVIDVGIADGALFLVMPLVDGGSLEGQRASFGDAKWATPLLGQIASGLAALHERGIIHRDLKPGNVLLSGGAARIADFGLASLAKPLDLADAIEGKDHKIDPALDATLTGHLNRNDSPPLTRHGDVFGTPPYMAPELESGVHDVKPSSDIFAFGLIAYELLTGKKAFAEPPLLLRLRGKPIPPPDMTAVPAWVARCLDLEPVTRPTAADLVEYLR